MIKEKWKGFYRYQPEKLPIGETKIVLKWIIDLFKQFRSAEIHEQEGAAAGPLIAADDSSLPTGMTDGLKALRIPMMVECSYLKLYVNYVIPFILRDLNYARIDYACVRYVTTYSGTHCSKFRPRFYQQPMSIHKSLF